MSPPPDPPPEPDLDPQQEVDSLRHMLVAVAQIQDAFLARESPRAAFGSLLERVLELTGSAYGFIGEVHTDPEGAPFLKTHAISNIAWNAETQAFYEKNAPNGLEFRNLDTLFGHALRTRELVISNTPATDDRRGGVPVGHPPLLAFAGIPVLHNRQLVGMIGLANRPGGYDLPLIARLQPVFDTIRTLIVAYRSERTRERIEAELRQSELENRRLATVASLTSNLVVVTEPSGRVMWVNEAFTRVTGYALDEFRGAYASDMLVGPRTDVARLDELMQLLRAGRSTVGFRLFIHARDGRAVEVELEVKPVRDANGRILQIVAIAADVTAERAAETKLRVSEAKFAAAFYGSADAILISRLADGVFFEANDAALALSGFPREELLGKSAVDLATWVEPARRDELQRKLRETHHVADFEARLFNAHGEPRDAILHASLIDIGGEPCQLTVIKDVTDARQADRAMRDNEQRLRAIFESAVDAIVLIDDHGLIEAVNPACERMFGYRHDELLGLSVGLLMPEPERVAHDHHLARQRHGAANRVIGRERELIAQRKDGSHFPVEIALAEIHDSRGRRFSGTIRDISRRKEAEAAASRLNRELSDSVEALERLNRENAIMSELRDLLQTCQVVEEVVRITMQFTRRLLAGTSGGLYLLDSARGLLEEVARWGDELQCEPVFAKDDCWALRRGRVFEVTPDEEGVACEHIPRGFAARSICVPLSAQGETLGLLHVEEGPSHPTPLDLRLPTALSEYLSLAIINVRMRETLRRQATRDPLTRLFNRRHLDDVFERELRRAQRHGRHLWVIIIDIDHFKHINDSRGHDVGDHVLVEVAQALERNIRAEDYAFRYGGEEFLLLLPEASAEGLAERASAFVEQVRSLALTWYGQRLERVTISAGAASCPLHGKTSQDLIRAADEALLRAKSRGRDRVEVAALPT